MDEFKTRNINGRPYHPQSQGRVERFNRTVVAYFRAQFVDTRDWPSLLGEFYYKYNNRVNKSTRPMTPHQRFSMALEEQVAKCNLTKEEKEFLEMAHVDVEEDDDDNNNLALNMLNENVKSEKINGNTNTEPGVVIQKNNEDQQSEMIDNTLTLILQQLVHQINSESVHKKEIARMDAENDYQEFVESLWNTRITNMINESESVITGNKTIISNVHYMQPENGVENVEVNNTVQTSNRSNEKIPSKQQLQMSQPLQDIKNSHMMRNTSLHQSEVSPYYKDLYARRFIPHTDSGMTGFKRRHLETEICMSENREEWDSSMYPEELFPKKVSKITEMQTFHPAVNEIIDFKPNSALSAGTNVFLSGYWKKGLVINIENDDSKGKLIQTVVHIRLQMNCMKKALHKLNQLTRLIPDTFQKDHRLFIEKNSTSSEILKGNTAILRTQIQNKLVIDLSERFHGEICKAFAKYGNDIDFMRNKLTFAADAIVHVDCYQDWHLKCSKHSLLCKGLNRDNRIRKRALPGGNCNETHTKITGHSA
ncbi:unnamed protein product [Mytilus coruscus]|uniref:Integrase catalytic domain-containing protein n=1 Tax=Mytilus coruscus TaxID=42192 RepID=A0A6J8BAS3_MYTCO|nr:unnamed protein product [Mytilus coruscus]